MLSNILLTPFDKEMRRHGYQLTRWADDWVVTCRTRAEAEHALARAGRILETLGVTLNREKTRIVRLRSRNGESLRFVGYEFRYAWSRFERDRRYFTVIPSPKTVERMKAKLRMVINSRRNFVPVSELIVAVNQRLGGWAQHFSYGHPRAACRELNHFVINRLIRHLKHRSQRPCRPPAGMSWYALVTGPLGLRRI